MLTLEPFSEDQGRSAVHPSGGSHQSASLRLTGQRAERVDAEARLRRALPTTIEETAFHERTESSGFGRPPNPRCSELAVQRAGSISISPPTAYVFGTRTPVPSPQSQSFSRIYGSILPTSLAYIVPSTRGCSPWRPDEVMSTTGLGRHSVLRIFKGRRECTGYHATCGALPAAGPYLRLSRFQGWQAVK
ncbi:hypothetical protein CQW23_35065 [Capsicum baccatum]|uniref:Protein TAR1 n=1 Tax=Capsicum baccatum TaxID=33114 RepID=A0A2G2UX41_CAPBA|nr:hypothetical protein CQW23_35065 [Capsicum baccatum]